MNTALKTEKLQHGIRRVMPNTLPANSHTLETRLSLIACKAIAKCKRFLKSFYFKKPSKFSVKSVWRLGAFLRPGEDPKFLKVIFLCGLIGFQ
jgi:hypothetical protein